MPRIEMKQVQGVGRVTLEYAIDQFMRHNRLKNSSLLLWLSLLQYVL